MELIWKIINIDAKIQQALAAKLENTLTIQPVQGPNYSQPIQQAWTKQMKYLSS